MYIHIPLTCSAWNRWEGLFDILAKTKLNKTWNTNTESKPKKYKRKQTGNVGSGITSKINIEARVFFTKLLDEPTTMKLKKLTYIFATAAEKIHVDTFSMQIYRNILTEACRSIFYCFFRRILTLSNFIAYL